MNSEFADESQNMLHSLGLHNRPQRMLPHTQGYEKMPLVTIGEAIEPLIPIVPEVERMVWIAKECCAISDDGLTSDESASIALYTLGWQPEDESFHVILNNTLMTANRTSLKPWFLYLRLIMAALTKIPSDSARMTVYRGLKMDLSTLYPIGSKVIWWSFSSCTISRDVVDNAQFLGQSSARTLFSIDCHSGKNIRKYSFYPEEQEVLLPPARQFEVTGNLNQDNDLPIIYLRETQPKYPLINVVQLPLRAPQNSTIIASPPDNKPIVVTANSKRSELSPAKLCEKDNLLEDQHSIVKSSPTLSESILSAVQPSRIQSIQSTATIRTEIPDTSKVPTCCNSWLQKYIDALYLDPISLSTSQIFLISAFLNYLQSVKDHLKALNKLDFEDKTIQLQDLSYLSTALKQNKTLITLCLINNDIGPKGAKHLANGFQNNTMLTTLIVRYNQIQDQGAQYIANALQQNKTLTTVYLGDNQIGPEGAQFLADALQRNKSIVTLNLSSNRIGPQGAQHFATALQRNNTLTTLNLECNQLRELGAKHLSNALLRNRTMIVLNLGTNEIGAKGAEHLAFALQQNTTITSLNLDGNRIGDLGAEYLSNALLQNETLTALYLRSNEIDDLGAEHLANALLQRKTVIRLDLSGNQLNITATELIEDIITSKSQSNLRG